MRKEALRAALVARLEADLATARAAHDAAIEGATHEEARPENDKDTRGLEQSYLARGLAQRVAELEAAVAAVPAMTLAKPGRVAIGAVVTVEEEARETRFFIAAHGGGVVLPGEVTVITPTSPIGRALLGRVVDDECELTAGGKRRTLVVVRID
ncbi:MAG: GreA/GreB family elongation factor [Deltaproteobacteria bacterium]|nr:GreA/GreB family elongation factor [Deltaproteobacteria bacterium]